ncbi:alpha/beta-hydrolase [Coniochaeta ligniaria NRRL 30616]|uniref:Alpha/beta-hydrolase n=1 Tax=Coniochaeta ligniaria NRRL 30616 TaxID=1408157 RepID=A0A1J7JIR6_9PEZI|nr:alpha/beta-hydrolase [Coniochaeta ligniaria NRRL 30616]
MDYPDPVVVPPRTLPHKQTFILLHGRGSSGAKFGPPLLDSPILTSPEPTSSAAVAADTTLSLSSAFPHARFVFPTAARRRATVYRRAYTHQWFDNWKLDPPATDREELQLPGLCETTAYLHGLLRAEIAAVPGGAANVVFGGLSQGCAASLTALLLWDGEPLGAVVGMCGWLPFAAGLVQQVSLVTNPPLTTGDDSADFDGDAFDPFEREDGEGGDVENEAAMMSAPARAVKWLKEEIQPPLADTNSAGSALGRTPIFLGHGTEDDRVSIVLGREAVDCLERLGFEVYWREYQSLGHWYSDHMLRDMVAFLREKKGWDFEK